tara:strand:+ start:33 stop:1418 length:1386 start_codon:yes stop_codon:yes gene_type:complete
MVALLDFLKNIKKPKTKEEKIAEVINKARKPQTVPLEIDNTPAQQIPVETEQIDTTVETQVTPTEDKEKSIIKKIIDFSNPMNVPPDEERGLNTGFKDYIRTDQGKADIIDAIGLSLAALQKDPYTSSGMAKGIASNRQSRAKLLAEQKKQKKQDIIDSADLALKQSKTNKNKADIEALGTSKKQNTIGKNFQDSAMEEYKNMYGKEAGTESRSIIYKDGSVNPEAIEKYDEGLEKNQSYIGNTEDFIAKVDALIDDPDINEVLGSQSAGVGIDFGQKGWWQSTFGSVANRQRASAALSRLDSFIAGGTLKTINDLKKLNGSLGLGAVSNMEFRTLQNAIGALSKKQSPESFRKELNKIRKSMVKIRNNTVKAGKKKYGKNFTIEGFLSTEERRPSYEEELSKDAPNVAVAKKGYFRDLSDQKDNARADKIKNNPSYQKQINRWVASAKGETQKETQKVKR